MWRLVSSDIVLDLKLLLSFMISVAVNIGCRPGWQIQAAEQMIKRQKADGEHFT